MFRFRTFRKCWLVATAVLSFVCIAISLSLYGYYEPKSDLAVLVGVPGLCLTASTTACVQLDPCFLLRRSHLTFISRLPFAQRVETEPYQRFR
ncbi:hypothetical protein BC826DRAFT_1037322 [Russula brevipes]|nr:hypothetical protein BC826DRAFT_1037322 [Russula brevipes]